MEPSDISKSCQQKRMGPAPFASFEDLSDEVRARVCISTQFQLSSYFRSFLNRFACKLRVRGFGKSSL